MKNFIYTGIVIVLLLAIITVSHGIVVPSDSSSGEPISCVFTGINNQTFDLKKLKPFTYNDTKNDNNYSFNLCSGFTGNQPCAGVGTYENSICVILKASTKTATQTYLGSYERLSQITPSSADYNLTLTYGGGAKCGMLAEISTVNFMCNNDLEEGESQVLSIAGTMQGTCYSKFTFVVQSSLFCEPVEAKKGLSGGDVFLIIFFCGFGAYFILGAVILAIKGHRGKDLIVNKHFWHSFFSLVGDGFGFIKSKITGHHHSSGDYEQVK
ncbi:hypothetical protein DLAC_11762 [Tieghemostelium lacteum]|uniref:Cation-dependent mannose-6-phosphate receptor n=1 Tax=Tieghemostelium lacteum TaxID=361077 RepID=A0A151Z9I2_TIELA|nr:hypothetical protein DLAC_11762 [Tieghemostelium lacteum]|eukprot:KYQ90524.1 hypothetical protein DLAC_11762 [Tieghemostelium lacteum]